MSTPSFEPTTSRGWLYPGLVIAAAIALGAVVATAGPLKDVVDVYWHVRLGGELLDGISIYDVGKDWSYAPVPHDWVSTQWIMEVFFAWSQRLWGWDALIVYRAVTTAITLAMLAFVTFRGRHREANRVWASVVVYTAAALTLTLFAQERPQQISFILMPLVGYWWLRAVRDGYVVKWWILLILTTIWANCHGLWVLLPAALGLAFIGRLWVYGRKDPTLKPLFFSGLATVVAGCITPVGPINLLAPIRFAKNTDVIVEWDPTNLTSPTSAALVLFAALLIIAWSRGREKPNRAELLFALLVLIFGTAAGRNVTPSVLLLAPLVAWRLSVAFCGPKRREVPVPLYNVTKYASMVTVGLTVAAIGYVAVISVPIPKDAPIHLVAQIANRTQPQRVLNGYNISGITLWFARPTQSKNFVQVGIDGRADLYGAAYIDQYTKMENGKPNWHETVIELNPTVALLNTGDPLTDLLKLTGWQEISREGDWVLIDPPAGGAAATAPIPK